MVLDASLLNTQHYKVQIKGKVEQSREWSSAPQYFGVVAIEKGAFVLPSTKVTNLFTLKGGNPCGIVANVLNCDIIVSGFDLQ